MEIDILIEADVWAEVKLDRYARECCEAALMSLGRDPTCFAVSLLACDDARIADLNGSFRDKPQPTNVLSWPSADRAAPPGHMPGLPDPAPDGPPEELGDIALAYETIAREAAEAGKPFDHHLQHLLVHGLLHLLGFDHIDDADAELMQGQETRILASLGVPDPY